MRTLVFLVSLILAATSYAALPGLAEKLVEIAGGNDVGVAVVTSDGDALSLRGDSYYDMCSVVKFHQAAALSRIMDFDSIMNATVLVDSADMRTNTWSPMRASLATLPYNASLVELLDYSLNVSDNNAADLIFNRFITANRVEQVLRDAGLAQDISIRSTEAQMHADLNRVPNLTTPDDAARCIYRFFTSDTTASATLVKAIMARESPFGKERIPAGVAEGETKVFHKTGTGFDGPNGTPRAINDLAFISYRRPGGYSCYALAVFLRDFTGTTAEGEKLIADISNAVWSAIVVNESLAMNASARTAVSKIERAKETQAEKFSWVGALFNVAGQIIYDAVDEAIDRKLSE